MKKYFQSYSAPPNKAPHSDTLPRTFLLCGLSCCLVNYSTAQLRAGGLKRYVLNNIGV